MNALSRDCVNQVSASYAFNYSASCSAALVLYDYLLTLPLELRYIWSGKFTIVKMLFILNRYATLIALYLPALQQASFLKLGAKTEYDAVVYTEGITSLLSTFATLSIFTLRTYAIYGRSKIVLFIISVSAVSILATGVWEAYSQTGFVFPGVQFGKWNCNVQDESISIHGAGLANIVSNVVFDLLVLVLTVFRTARLAIRSRKAKVPGSLSFILLRDGVLYYSAFFIPQLITVSLSSALIGEVWDIQSYISYSLKAVLVNRLVLNLSDAANASDDTEFRTRTGLEPPMFATGPVLGNIGGPVRTRSDNFVDEDLEGDEVSGINDAETKSATDALTRFRLQNAHSNDRDLEYKSII